MIYVKGDPNDPSMSINDEDGRVYVNINGADFGDPESMRKTAQHEGSHGTYTNKDTDENSADRIGNNKGTTTKPNIVIDSSMDEDLETGQLAYDKDREDNKLRDKWYVSADELLKWHLNNKGTINIEYFAKVYGNGSIEDYVHDAIMWEKSAKKTDTLVDYMLGVIEKEFLGQIPHYKWIVRGLDVTKILTEVKRSNIEDKLIGYAYSKKSLLQEMSNEIVAKSDETRRKILTEAAKVHFSGQEVSNNTFQDYVDKLVYEYNTDTKNAYQNYKQEIDAALNNKKINASGLTVRDLYDMSIDGNGFYELGRKDKTNPHGDPDYFFETGKFQFKPGMEKGYLKKLGL